MAPKLKLEKQIHSTKDHHPRIKISALPDTKSFLKFIERFFFLSTKKHFEENKKYINASSTTVY
jgi:hypothetical protein